MRSILVVDDHALIREPIEAVLRAEGYTTYTASDGPEALQFLAHTVPDLMFLDLSMPMMNGLQVLEHMRGDLRLKNVPVMVLSSAGDRARVERAATLGVSGYVLKSSFSLDGLLQRVKEHFAPEHQHPLHRGAGDSAGPSSLPTEAHGHVKVHPAKCRGVASQPDPVSNPSRAVGSLAPLMSRHELIGRVARGMDLKGLSPAVSHVLTLTANPHCSTDAVAKAISQDQAIALKILKLANSSVYTRGAPVESVQKAVVRIGIDRIRQTVLNVSVVDRFSAPAFEKHLSTQQFWEHAIACGVIASEIAVATREMPADSAFTIGLLHDVGRLILAEQLGADYVKVIAAAKDLGRPLEEVEARMLGAQHAEVTGSILESWHFSKDLARPIVRHHAPFAEIRAESPHTRAATAILALADRLAHAVMLGSSGNDTIYPTGELCSLLGIGAGVVARLKAVAREQTDNMKMALVAEPTAAPWSRLADEVRATFRVPFRPLFIGASPATDAFAMFCSQLAEPVEATKSPTVAVVHVERPTDRRHLGEQLEKLEAELKSGELPILELVPADDTGVGLERRASRPFERVEIPATIGAIVAAVNRLGGHRPV